MPKMPHGAFGENLAIAGWSEESVSIGGALRIGGPCSRSASRDPVEVGVAGAAMDLPPWSFITDAPAGRLRVLEQGWIESGNARHPRPGSQSR